jgi:hypothetical protein
LTEVLTPPPFMRNVAQTAVPRGSNKVLFPAISTQGQPVHHAGRLGLISVYEDDRDREAVFRFRYAARDVTVIVVGYPVYRANRHETLRTQSLFCLHQP